MTTRNENILRRTGTEAELRTPGQLLEGQTGFASDANKILHRRRADAPIKPGEIVELTNFADATIGTNAEYSAAMANQEIVTIFVKQSFQASGNISVNGNKIIKGFPFSLGLGKASFSGDSTIKIYNDLTITNAGGSETYEFEGFSKLEIFIRRISASSKTLTFTEDDGGGFLKYEAKEGVSILGDVNKVENVFWDNTFSGGQVESVVAGDGVSVNNTNPKSPIVSIDGLQRPLVAGVITTPLPDFTYAGFSLSIPSVEANVWSNENFSGTLKKYTIPAASGLPIVDGGNQTLCIDYNGGSPIYRLVDSNLERYNLSTLIPVYDIWRVGSEVHSNGYDSLATATNEKAMQRVFRTEKYKREHGLIISESGTPNERTIKVTEGKVYSGIVECTLGEFNSNLSPYLSLMFWNGSEWIYELAQSYDILHYNGPTGKVAGGTSKWLVRWYYRTIGDDLDLFYTIGKEQYNSYEGADAAPNENQGPLPPLITKHSILIGKTIVQTWASSGITTSLFDTDTVVGGGLGSDELVKVNSIGAAGYLVDKIKKATGSPLMISVVGDTLEFDISDPSISDPLIQTTDLMNCSGTMNFAGSCWNPTQAAGDWGGLDQNTTDFYARVSTIGRGTISRVKFYVKLVNGDDLWIAPSGTYSGAIRIGLFDTNGVLKGATNYVRGITQLGTHSLTMYPEPGQNLTIERNTEYWIGIVARGLDVLSVAKAGSGFDLGDLRYSVTIHAGSGQAEWTTNFHTTGGFVQNNVAICSMGST